MIRRDEKTVIIFFFHVIFLIIIFLFLFQYTHIFFYTHLWRHLASHEAYVDEVHGREPLSCDALW